MSSSGPPIRNTESAITVDGLSSILVRAIPKYYDFKKKMHISTSLAPGFVAALIALTVYYLWYETANLNSAKNAKSLLLW